MKNKLLDAIFVEPPGIKHLEAVITTTSKQLC